VVQLLGQDRGGDDRGHADHRDREQRGEEREDADHDGQRGREVEEHDAFARLRPRRPLPQPVAEDQRRTGHDHRADAERDRPDPAEPVRDEPYTGRDDAERAGAQGGRQRPRQPGHEPPRAVRPDHADEEAQVAADHGAHELDRALVRVCLADRRRHLLQPAAHPPPAPPALAPRLPAQLLAEQVLDETQHGGLDPSLERDGSEGGDRHESDAVCHARVRGHRPAFHEDRRVGQDDREVPPGLEQPPVRDVDEVDVADRRGRERLLGRFHLPLHLGEALGQLWRQRARELLRKVVRQPGRREQRQPDGLPALRRGRRARVLGAAILGPIVLGGRTRGRGAVGPGIPGPGILVPGILRPGVVGAGPLGTLRVCRHVAGRSSPPRRHKAPPADGHMSSRQVKSGE
jgi:hypothetical protein